jgi:uridine phosphorylase
VARRREQGCITVEMEASAMFACASFRGAVYGQLLYAGDDVSAAEWDHRHWDRQHGARERLLDLALDAAIRL